MSDRWLGFDVGGANIKLAGTDGYTDSRAFPLWKSPEKLTVQLSEMLREAPTCDGVAATMTGELADCYSSKSEGVRAIIEALCESAGDRSLAIYLTDGTFVDAETACAQPLLAAASNWHALALASSRLIDGDAILVDIGSTTCDVIPVSDGEVLAGGRTDTERLVRQELVYAGIERTPVCAISATLPWRDRECPVAREFFATTLDVHLVTGDVVDRPDDCNTADGRPATRAFAIDRLGRCICADKMEFSAEDAQSVAEFVSHEMSELLQDAVRAVGRRSGFSNSTQIILSGHGDFLLQRVLRTRARETSPVVSLSELIGVDVARCAPAWAVAKLAAEGMATV